MLRKTTDSTTPKGVINESTNNAPNTSATRTKDEVVAGVKEGTAGVTQTTAVASSWGGGKVLGSSTQPHGGAVAGRIVRRLPGIGIICNERPKDCAGPSNAWGDKGCPDAARGTDKRITADISLSAEARLSEQNVVVVVPGAKMKRTVEFLDSSDSEDECTLHTSSNNSMQSNTRKVKKKTEAFHEDVSTGATVKVPGFKSVCSRSSSLRGGRCSDNLAANRNQRAHHLSSDSESSEPDSNERLTLASVMKRTPSNSHVQGQSKPTISAGERASPVSCPVCHMHVQQDAINAHLDTCLQ